MKIVLFDFFIHYGGAPQLAAETCKRLAVDHDVEVINVYGVCREYVEVLKGTGIKLHILDPETQKVIVGYQNNKLLRSLELTRRIPSFLQVRNRLIRKIRELDPDVIWTTTDKSLLFLMLSPILNRYPVVKYDCGYLETGAIGKWQRFVNKKRATVIMTSSTETAKQLELAGIAPEHLKVVFETIDIAGVLEQIQDDLEGPLPGQEISPRILVPSTLLRTKGQHTAIKAVGRLKSQGINSTLWLAGDVVGNDNSYLEYLKDLAVEVGVSENVYFLGWRNDIYAVMNLCDIVLLPTYTEGFGRVALEAMLLRKVAVTTPAGGMKDSIQDGYDGLFFSVNDDKSLAKQLVRLITDSQFSAKLIENGYKTVTEKFNPEAHTKKVLTAFSSAVELVKKQKKS